MAPPEDCLVLCPQGGAKNRVPRARAGKLNGDENPRLAARFQVRSISRRLFFEGALPREEIVRRGALFLSS